MDHSKSPNPGIKCEVDDCEHYMSGDLCNASVIKVVPLKAKEAENADCLTFKPNSHSK